MIYSGNTKNNTNKKKINERMSDTRQIKKINDDLPYT